MLDWKGISEAVTCLKDSRFEISQRDWWREMRSITAKRPETDCRQLQTCTCILHKPSTAVVSPSRKRVGIWLGCNLLNCHLIEKDFDFEMSFTINNVIIYHHVITLGSICLPGTLKSMWAESLKSHCSAESCDTSRFLPSGGDKGSNISALLYKPSGFPRFMLPL